MNLKALADPHCEERENVDVIWFPTGGGKTEAYLGLSAFTMFLRRIRNPDHTGTAIVMRYTLRLLTTQQFQRAASLICACEVIRRRRQSDLGSGRFQLAYGLAAMSRPMTSVTRLKRSSNSNRVMGYFNSLRGGPSQLDRIGAELSESPAT